MWAQSDYSTTYTSNVTLSSSGGTSASVCTVNGHSGIKCGTGSVAGAMKLTAPQGAKYLHIHVAGWNNEDVTVSVSPNTNISPNSIRLTSDSDISGNSPFNLSGTESSNNYYKVITFTTPLESNTQLTFSATSGRRFVIWGVNSEEEADGPFNVTYDANDATSGFVPTDDTDYDKDATVIVLGNTGNLVKDHYTFGGWNTRSDGSGTTYATNATFSISSNTTLYAKWNINTHGITLPEADTYGSYSATATESVPYGTEITLTYTPASGYNNYYAIWSVNGEELNGNTFDMPDEDVVVTVVVEEIPDYAKLPVKHTGGRSSLPTGFTQSGLGSDYASSPNLKFDGTGDYLILKINEAPGILCFDIKGNNMSGGTFTLQKSVDGSSYTEVKSYTGLNNTQSSQTIYDLGADIRYIKWIYTNKNNGNVGLGNISLAKAITATVSSVGWTTFSNENAIDFTGITAVKAYMVTNASGETLTLSQLKGTVPANTGLLLCGDAGEEVVIPAVASSSTSVTANKLVASTGSTVNAADKYVLVARDGKAVFAPTDENAATVAKGKAYLDLEGVTLARGFFLDDSETTGVREIDTMKNIAIGQFYNLAGQRVAQPQKGLYIVNNKKIVIR